MLAQMLITLIVGNFDSSTVHVVEIYVRSLGSAVSVRRSGPNKNRLVLLLRMKASDLK